MTGSHVFRTNCSLWQTTTYTCTYFCEYEWDIWNEPRELNIVRDYGKSSLNCVFTKYKEYYYVSIIFFELGSTVSTALTRYEGLYKWHTQWVVAVVAADHWWHRVVQGRCRKSFSGVTKLPSYQGCLVTGEKYYRILRPFFKVCCSVIGRWCSLEFSSGLLA